MTEEQHFINGILIREIFGMCPDITSQINKISSNVSFGNNVRIIAQSLDIGNGVSIGDDVTIEGKQIKIESGSKLGNRLRINAGEFYMGYCSQIDDDCELGAIGRPAQEIRFGDNCYFGSSNTALMPILLVGDFVKIHNHTLINGFKPCYIGHNSWIGQNCVLNCNDVLYVGNNVCIGTYNSIWTHAFWGELLEGSNVNNVAPTILDDDVWLVGSYNTISPGVTLGKRSMILTSTVVTKSITPGKTIAGIPARDLTNKLPPFRIVEMPEKIKMMEKFVHEFVEASYPNQYTTIESGLQIKPKQNEPFKILIKERFSDVDSQESEIQLIYVTSNSCKEEYPHITIFDLSTKTYTKRRTYPEIQIIKFMNNFRARFIPQGFERVGQRPEIFVEVS